MAAGLLGAAAFEGGTRTFLLGVALHFVVAACVAAVYYVLSLKAPLLVRHAVASGLVYGLIVHLVMSFVVVPLSAAGAARLSLPTFLPALIAHAFLVGLPVALIARRSSRTPPPRSVQRR